MSDTEKRFARLKSAVRRERDPMRKAELQLRLEAAARIASQRHFAVRKAALRVNF